MEPVFDLQRIWSETFVRSIEYRRSTASTNDLAMQLVRGGADELPLLVLAEQQTRGRGRGANRWWSSEGALTFTLVIDSSAAGLPSTDNNSLLALVTAVAICETLDQLDLPEAIRLKWPNDVLAGRRKVTGILAEVPARPRDRILVGVGINVNNPLTDAPAELQEQATSLADLAGHPFDLTEILVRSLEQLSGRLRDFADGSLHLRQLCDRWCALNGKNVKVKLGNRRLSGQCKGIDETGALLVDCKRTHRVTSGVIEHIDWGR
jgi:BirA family biotin operon repressor/biotin-[acetyl-CoA-carboxylase] ligase